MTNSPPVQASRPFLGDAEARAVARVLASGYLGMGPETRAFEAELETYLEAPGRAVTTAATGTSALHLAFAALGLGPGDEVLVPSLTFVASFQAVAVTGAHPVACDVLEASGLIDLEDAERRVTSRTRALMPVHYAGNVGDLEAAYAFAARHGLRVVEDAAHAFGTRSRGRLVGSFGDVACFSFDPIKNITCGQGGAIVTGDAAVTAAARRMRNLAIEPGGEVRGPGWRYALSDLNAAIGRVQLGRFEQELKPRRQALVARYRERLANVRGLALLEGDPEAVQHIFPVRIEGGHRDRAQAALREAGCETLVHYRPNHQLAAFRAEGCPVADRLFGELLTLPLHPAVTADDVDRIAAILGKTLAG